MGCAVKFEQASAITFMCGPSIRACSGGGCGIPAFYLCDFDIGGRTCDAPICPRHSVRIDEGTDYCYEHGGERCVTCHRPMAEYIAPPGIVRISP